MKVGAVVSALIRHEPVNFLLTNRIPRAAATRFMGWFSRIEQPWFTRVAIVI
jgi:phosphatidylserine decarboxylase